MILDGWGIAADKNVSAIDQAHTPFMDSLMQNRPHSQLVTHGEAVGLPDGQMGNSEVGHMNLGAGRIVYQDLVKINKAIKSGETAENKVLNEAFDYANKHNKKVHFIGLVSDGGVHAHIDHLIGLTRIGRDKGIAEMYVHAFTDGRDCDPKSGKGFIEKLINAGKETGAQLASVTGRYFAMDRDNRWERIKLAYDAMVHGTGQLTSDPLSAIQESYDNGVTDEFMKPLVVSGSDRKPAATIEEGDVVINFNFRTDRGRQITTALTQKDFPDHDMKALDLHYCTMTRYDDTFRNVRVIYEKDNLKNTLGEVLEQAGKKQLRMAETEKYPHVTYFFSGGKEDAFDGEKRIMVNSPKVATYDLQPEMSAPEVRDKLVEELTKGESDFVCINYANPDMVGHTGVFEAAVKACGTVDACVKDSVEAGLRSGYEWIILADHGNSDCLINPDGSPNTAHTKNPVPCIWVSDERKGLRVEDGKLGDIAPTILKLMDLSIPDEMTGNILVE